MEYKMKKSMALGVVIMLCAVAMVGVGYAAFSGTARTYNDGNSADAGFLKLDNASFSNMVGNNIVTEFDMYDAASGDCYYFADNTGVVGINASGVPVAENPTYLVKAVGGTNTITISQNTGADITAIGVKVKSSAVVSNSDFIYFMKASIAGVDRYIAIPASTAYSSAMVFNDFNGASEGTPALVDQDAAEGLKSLTMTVQVFIGYEINKYIPDTFIGDVVTASDASHSIGARASTSGPVDLASVGFGFEVTDASS